MFKQSFHLIIFIFILHSCKFTEDIRNHGFQALPDSIQTLASVYLKDMDQLNPNTLSIWKVKLETEKPGLSYVSQTCPSIGFFNVELFSRALPSSQL